MITRYSIPEEELAAFRHLIPGPDPVVQKEQRYLPVASTLLDGNELLYLQQCLESNWISSAGPFVQQFEQKFAEAVSCRFGIACANGTVALHLTLMTLGLGAGDEVILPAFTMIAVVNTVSQTGATPVLVDVRPETFNLDVAQIEAKITARTRAIIAVHTYGHPAQMDELAELARRYHLYLIEDAAEAHGAEYRGRRVGSLSDAAAFSFYANKIITTGEGGMMTTNNPELAEIARTLRDHAFSQERHFWHSYRGFNYRMTNLQAALGLAQTERLAELVERRRTVARLYSEQLSSIPGLTLPQECADGKNVFWMYGVLIEPEFGCSRDELRSWLAQHGIETRTFFIPIHFQPAYYDCFRGEHYPVAESLCQRGLYLPSGAMLTEAEIQFVVETIARLPRDSSCLGR